jgi:hypothetical protein
MNGLEQIEIIRARREVRRLLYGWIGACQREVEDYLANNGHGAPDPRQVAAACPTLAALEDGATVAAWHLKRITEPAP